MLITMGHQDSERVEALFWAELIIDGQSVPTSMLSLSMNSIELEIDPAPAIDTACSVRVQLCNRQNTDLPVLCEGIIVAHSEDGALFQIDKVDDEEGLENLRNLVLFHANDPKKAADEIK